MKNLKYILYSLAILLSLGGLTSCDDEALDHIVVTFAGPFGGTVVEGQSANFQVVFSRPIINNSTILLKLNSDVAVYGQNYTTSPQSFVAGELRLDVPAGSTTASFSINTADDNTISSSGPYQLEVVIDELTGDFFSKTGSNIVLQISDPPTAIYTFDACSGSIDAPFITVNETGSNPFTWGCTNFGNNFTSGVQYNPFSSGSSDPSDAWLILDINAIEKSDGTLVANADLSTLSVELGVQSFFSGPGDLTMWYSQDYVGSGDPSAATWTELTDFATQLPEDGSRVWTDINVDASAVTGSANGYVAIRHTGGVGGSADSWTLDDFAVFAGE
ncbi:MAG: hypothetical protein ACPGJS_19270 [Flammeovirgaceae bacterium]